MATQDDKFARLSKRSSDRQVVQPTADVVVRPDEGGEALAGTLESAQDGQVIRIAAGTYRLTRPVKVTRSLTIVGDGRSTTRLVSSAPGDCFTIDGPIRFSATGIGFEHEGDTFGNVVKIGVREAEFKNCRFSGARELSDDSFGQGCGLVVTDESEVVCDDCEATKNDDVGILFVGKTTGVVSSCRASDNAAGLGAAGRSRVLYGDNVVSRNRTGILIGGEATCEASRNECCDNTESGIDVSQNSSAALDSNRLQRNKVGLIFSQHATGSARKNICSDNSMGGIDVQEEAHPSLEDNRCEKNGNRGIVIGGNAYGTVRGNVCNENETFGIIVLDEAHPILEGNHCGNNGETGIGYLGRATGICRGNKVEGNPQGIGVNDDASPQIQAEDGSQTTAAAASGDASGDCFVATATYGTPFAPEVARLRAYRDQVLTGHAAGRLFVRLYYAIGPSLAALIRRVPVLRLVSARFLGRIARHLPNS